MFRGEKIPFRWSIIKKPPVNAVKLDGNWVATACSLEEFPNGETASGGKLTAYHTISTTYTGSAKTKNIVDKIKMGSELYVFDKNTDGTCGRLIYHGFVEDRLSSEFAGQNRLGLCFKTNNYCVNVIGKRPVIIYKV